jgi:O-antigen/teichoic acid export membrane protein
MISWLQSLKSHKALMNYFNNTSWLFAEKVIRIITSLVIGIWVVRYLGPEQLGLLSYAQSFVGLFAAIASLGLDSIVVRELVKHESQRDVLLGTSFVLKLSGGFLMLVILGVVTAFSGNDSLTNILIFIVASGVIVQSFNVIDYYFQSKVMSKYVSYASTISLFVSSLIKIILILNKSNLIYFAFVIFLDNFFVALGLIYYYQTNKLSIKKWDFNTAKAKAYLSESSALIVSFFMTSVSLQINQVILKGLLDAKSLGLYAASLRLTEQWYIIPVLFTTSLFPSIVKPKNSDDFQIKTKALSSLLVYMALIISFLLFTTRKYLVDILFGSEYLYTANILGLHAFAIIFVFFVSFRKKTLIAEGLVKTVMFYSTATAILMVILSYFFISTYGILGAPIAYTFTWAASVLLVPLIIGRFREDVVLFFQSFNLNSLKFFYKNLNLKNER